MKDKPTFSIDNFHNALIIEPSAETKRRHKPGIKRIAHLNYVLSQLTIPGEVMEFGVHTGGSIRRIGEYFPMQSVYGFDSFEGLPEAWFMTQQQRNKESKIAHPVGHFALDRLPQVSQNTILVKGFFDTSLPQWLSENPIKQIKLLHIDSDLSSSAKTVLTLLNEYIVPGTTIIFDELYPWGSYKEYDLWEEGEWQALTEWITEFDRSIEVISRNCHQQAAIRIIK